jgi:hypothetical protein
VGALGAAERPLFHTREHVMDRAEKLKQVAVELEHIPRWPGEYQGQLRSIYQLLRMNGLGAKKAGTAGEVLRRCLALIRWDVPDAHVRYDRVFFDG